MPFDIGTRQKKLCRPKVSLGRNGKGKTMKNRMPHDGPSSIVSCPSDEEAPLLVEAQHQYSLLSRANYHERSPAGKLVEDNLPGE